MSAGTVPGVVNRAGRKAGIHFPPAGSPAENGSRSNRIIAKFFSRLLKRLNQHNSRRRGVRLF